MLRYWNGTAWRPSAAPDWAGLAYQNITVGEVFNSGNTNLNYLESIGSAINLSASASANAGQIDMSWTYNNSVGPSTGIVPIRNYDGAYLSATDGHAYSNALYATPNISGSTAPETTSSAYSWTGLANATDYSALVIGRNAYRSGQKWSNSVSVRTKTVRQYGRINVGATWSASYNGADAIRSDAGGNLYAGYYGTNQGIQKSLLTYTFPQVPAGAVVYSAAIALQRGWDYYHNGANTVMYVTSLKSASAPGTLGGIAYQLVNGGFATTENNAVWVGLQADLLSDDIAGQSWLTFRIDASSTIREDYGWFYGHLAYSSPIDIYYYWDS